MNLKLLVAEARRVLILAAREVPEPIDPVIGTKFGEALIAMNDLVAMVDPPTPVTPVLSCPHNPLVCKGCHDNACFN